MKYLYRIFTIALLVAISAGSGFAQELVLNGDLESWDDPNTPTSWNKAENVSQNTATVHGGTYSAAHQSSPDGTQDLQQDVSGIVAGTNYTITYYFYDNDDAAKSRIWSYWLDGDTYLTDNEAELRPSVYSSNSDNWQIFTVTLTAPPTADGFRFEVRAYHENNVTGGYVYYDDFSIQVAGLSPEPTNYPTDFSAQAAGININLDWTDATGDQLPNAYLVLASTEDNISAPADGTQVNDDTDLSDGNGALNIAYGLETCSFDGLETNATYYFKIYPYTNGGSDIDYKNDGTAPSASATTADITIIESENFDNGWGDWIRVSVSGAEEWEIDQIHGIDGSPCAKCSGWDGTQSNINEDWLISPPMNFDNYSQEMLSFYNADAYAGAPLEVYISNDFDGADPTTATWTALEFETSSGYFEWISSGNIDVSNINGSEVYVGFKFTSTAQESATWEVDDVLITGSGASAINDINGLKASFSIYPNPASENISINTTAQGILAMEIYAISGSLVLQQQMFEGSVSVDVSQFHAGLYLIYFRNDAGDTRVEKLIIER